MPKVNHNKGMGHAVPAGYISSKNSIKIRSHQNNNQKTGQHKI